MLLYNFDDISSKRYIEEIEYIFHAYIITQNLGNLNIQLTFINLKPSEYESELQECISGFKKLHHIIGIIGLSEYPN